MKAAAHTAAGDAAKGRHRFDFATLAALIAARDFREVELSRKDLKRLGIVFKLLTFFYYLFRFYRVIPIPMEIVPHDG